MVAERSPYVYASVNYTVKHKPSDQRGAITERYIFGKMEPVPLHELSYLFTMAAVLFSAQVGLMTGKEGLEEIKLLIGKLVEFVEKQEGVLVRSIDE